MLIGRLAPTPSGRMHLGNLLSALLCWLAVRSEGGRLLLRIEDLDPQRTDPQKAQLVRQDLAAFGICWDEEVAAQSTRNSFYQSCLAQLQAAGLVYPCFCSRAELHVATAPHASDGSYIYSGRCRSLTAEQIAEKSSLRSPALRIHTPNTSLFIDDLCQGRYAENLATHSGDYILRRSDGVFAYQLATPADDGEQGVSLVVRGCDLLQSAPRQAWLMQQLGYRAPKFAHTPLLLAPDGRRLAKRDQDLSLAALLTKGYTPQQIIGQLAHLIGLVPTAEPICAEQLLPHFCWSKLCRHSISLPPDFLA